MRETAAWVGRRIRGAREAADLSQGALAAKVGKNQATISHWESGKRSPGLDELVQVAEVLDRDVSEFLPPATRSEPSRVLLRAVAARLDASELEDQLDAFVERAEKLPALQAKVRVAADRPLRAAQELLARGDVEGARVEPPIDVEALAELCGVRVVHHRFSKELSGLFIATDDGAVIGANKAQVANRQRFTIAHELAHFLLRHHDRFHIDLGLGPEDGNAPFHDWQLEREANDFAAHLLMPATVVRERFKRSSSVPELAADFGVSELAMGYRLLDLGLR
jgi:transcriptional regulator with XRE-family HTH domain